MVNSRSATSSSGGVRITSTATSTQRPTRCALDDADAAAGQARVDPKHAHEPTFRQTSNGRSIA